jgi:hypothetical protein
MNSLGVRSWGRKWMITKTSNTTKEMTHLLLDGGKLHVPPKDEKLFLRKLAADNMRGIKNYIVELRTPIYKFHADLDVFEDKIKPYSEIRDWIREMLLVLREFYKDWKRSSIPLTDEVNVDFLTTLVCTTEPKVGAQKYGKTYSKVGVHIVLPWLKVDTETALKLRSAFIQRFYEEHGPRPEDQNEWEDVFDHTVYTQNGLRMVGCSKIERCNTCKPPFKFVKGKPLKCPEGKCNGWGKIDVGRVYKITDVLGGDGSERKDVLQELLSDDLLSTHITSIRLLKEKKPHPFTLPDWYNPDELEKKLAESQKNKSTQSKIRLAPLTPSRTALTTLEKEQLDIDTPPSKPLNVGGEDEDTLKPQRARMNAEDNRRQIIEDWFRDPDYLEWYLVPEIYRNISIDDVILSIPTIGERYYIINTSSRYCQNLQREHNSNGIYFVLNRTGLYQKCFCRCNTTEGRVSGKRCVDYHSPGVRVPNKILTLLFPYSDEIKSASKEFFGNDAGRYIGMSTHDKVRSRLRKF